jgi:hypothetical protein
MSIGCVWAVGRPELLGRPSDEGFISRLLADSPGIAHPTDHFLFFLPVSVFASAIAALVQLGLQVHFRNPKYFCFFRTQLDELLDFLLHLTGNRFVALVSVPA